MVMTLDCDSTFCQRQRDLRAQVAQGVHRRHRHVALLGPNTVAKVGALGLACVPSTVPMAFVGIDRIPGAVLFVVEQGAIENKELGFRAKVRDIRDAGALKIAFGADGHGAGIESITLTRDRVDRVGNQTKRWHIGKWIHPAAT